MSTDTPSINVTIWNEHRAEVRNDHVKAIYPDGMHGPIADALTRAGGMNVRCAFLDDDGQGLTQEIIDGTDVLLWWGHGAHQEVTDENTDRVQKAVLGGMGYVPLHSSHISKPFCRLMGTSGMLNWRDIGEKQRLWNLAPGHPITEGIGEYFEIPRCEMYGERWDVPTPDEQIFISWFEGGDVFRSGCVWKRGNGRIFYFQPGHETYPIYYQEEVLRVITNATRWVANTRSQQATGQLRDPIENVG